jgi:hypothetical protein
MTAKEKSLVLVVVIIIIYIFLNSGGYLKANTKLQCKYDNSSSVFYIKIIEKNFKNIAYEYDRPGFKKDMWVTSFDVTIGQNYWGLWKQDQMSEFSKTRDYINIRKSDLNIYSQQYKKIIGSCNKV